MLRFFQENLFARIGFIALAMVILLLGSLFYFLAYRIVQADNLARTITGQLTSQAVLDKVDRNFYERFGDVQAFAFSRPAKESLDSGKASPNIQAFINTMTTYYVLYDLMMICDLQGRVLVTNTIDKRGIPINTDLLFQKNVANEEWFRVCISENGPEGGAWYSEFLINRDVAKIYEDNGYGMAFAAPIKNNNGQTIGVWYNFASWKEVTQAIRVEAETELQKMDPAAQIILVEKSGKIIDASDDHLIAYELSLDEHITDSPGTFLTIKNQKYIFDDYISNWATAKGAYTYRGNQWKAVTLLPKSGITWGTFFSRDLLPFILSTLLAVFALGFYIYLHFRNGIIRKINGVKQTLETLAQGELNNVSTTLQSRNELGQMVLSLSHMVEALKKKAVFSDEIAQGNLYTELQVVSEKDVLGHSLINMQRKLREIALSDKQRNWATEGLAKFNEILRVNEDMVSLCDHILAQLVHYMDAHQGALFVSHNDEEGQVWLELTACYAFSRKKFLENQKITPGEDLIGQAFLEKEIIYLKEIPREYLRINTGLLDAVPSSVMIIPLKINENVEGIIELASFRTYESFEIDFVVKLAENIASTLTNVKINERTRRLLEQSQQQAEEMKAQEEEMRQNMEELQATQEEVQRSERGYKLQIRQLEEAISELSGKSGTTISDPSADLDISEN